MTEISDQELEAAVADFVKNELGLAIYNPLQLYRKRVPVRSFDVELFETDFPRGMVHAAGPVCLAPEAADPVELFLRVSVPVRREANGWKLDEDGGVRAVYVFETAHPEGACREANALASV